MSTSNPNFLSLPNEVRDNIYRHTLVDVGSDSADVAWKMKEIWVIVEKTDTSWGFVDGLPDLRLRGACSQIRDEVDHYMSTYLGLDIYIDLRKPAFPARGSITTGQAPSLLRRIVRSFIVNVAMYSQDGLHDTASFEWIDEMDAMKNVYFAIAGDWPTGGQDSSSYAMRGLMAPFIASLPKEVDLAFGGSRRRPEETAKITRGRWMFKEDLECIGKWAEPMRGSSIKETVEEETSS